MTGYAKGYEIGFRTSGSGRHGKEACINMIHNIEGAAGRGYCEELMDIDNSYGIKVLFQFVPDGAYEVTPDHSQARFQGWTTGFKIMTAGSTMTAEFLQRRNY
jgi:hypothetical protein